MAVSIPSKIASNVANRANSSINVLAYQKNYWWYISLDIYPNYINCRFEARPVSPYSPVNGSLHLGITLPNLKTIGIMETQKQTLSQPFSFLWRIVIKYLCEYGFRGSNESLFNLQENKKIGNDYISLHLLDPATLCKWQASYLRQPTNKQVFANRQEHSSMPSM